VPKVIPSLFLEPAVSGQIFLHSLEALQMGFGMVYFKEQCAKRNKLDYEKPLSNYFEYLLKRKKCKHENVSI
jgi:hypothetical protein